MTALNRSPKGFYLIDGVKYPSVTTILGAIAKPALTSWAAKSVAEEAVLHPDEWIPIAKRDQAAAIDHLKGAPWRARDKGGALGTLLHTAIEAHTLGLPLPDLDAENGQPMMDAYLAWAEKARPVWALSEATVCSKNHGYAGTMDGIIEVNGRTLAVDLKTSKPGRQGHGLYPEIALQLAAYTAADVVCLSDGSQVPMPPVDGAAGLWLRPGICRLFSVDAGPEALAAFLATKAVAEWTWAEHAWVGDEIMPTVVEGVAL